jgi:SAM-dependent methyltransferase
MRDQTTLCSGEAVSRHWPARLQRILPHLACPACHGELREGPGELHCPPCHQDYPIRGGKIYFIEPLRAKDALDVIKSKLKRYLGAAYYTVGVRVVAPSFPFNYGNAIRKHIAPTSGLIVDLGCGNFRIDKEVVTLDGSDYDAVDIIADLKALPFRDGSIDALCSRGVLEHVSDIHLALEELRRCTKPGGLGIHLVPFVFPFHASPHDYTRWTPAGFPQLFSGWKVIEQRGTTGPVSLLLICFLEFMSVLFSFGVPRLKGPVYLLFCLCVFPLKFLDAPFVGRDSFVGLAPTILNVLRRPVSAQNGNRKTG